MPLKTRVTRKAIIEKLLTELEPQDYAYAFYEGGAAAFNRIDEWSDIDLYLLVEENRAKDARAVVDKALGELSRISQKYEPKQLPWPGVSQVFYKLENASEYLLIDLAIVYPSAPEKFLQPDIHGKAVFYFNKENRAKAPPLDRGSLEKAIQERLKLVRNRFDMFNVFVQKEINRSNWIEALDLYRTVTLGLIVDLLRIKHSPLHYDFKTSYVKLELPKEINGKLERLYFVKDENDLQKKYLEATEWLQTLIREDQDVSK